MSAPVAQSPGEVADSMSDTIASLTRGAPCTASGLASSSSGAASGASALASSSGWDTALSSGVVSGLSTATMSPRGPLLSQKRRASIGVEMSDAKSLASPSQPAHSASSSSAVASPSADPKQQAAGAGTVSISIGAGGGPSIAAAIIAAAAVSPPSVAELPLPPRVVNERVWLAAFTLPLLVWLSATGAAIGLDETGSDSSLFFEPRSDVAVDVSAAWVHVGWALNWTATAAHVVLLVLLRWRHTPFSGAITLGSLLHVTLMALAAACHSNALHASDVLSPASDPQVVPVQLEWLAFMMQLLLFVVLLFQAPHRVLLPVVADLRRRPQIELLSVLRQVQGELALATAQWEASKAALAAEEQSALGGTGQGVVARSQLDDILRSRRVDSFQGLRASIDAVSQVQAQAQPPLLVREGSLPAVGVTVTPDNRRKSRRRSGGPLALAGGSGGGTSTAPRRGSLERAASLDAHLSSPDSRDTRHQLDHDLQKLASALRASVAAGEAAVTQAQLSAPASSDAVRPFDQFLSVQSASDASDASGPRGSRHRHTRSGSKQHQGTSSLRVPRPEKRRHRREQSAAVSASTPDPDFLRQVREQVQAAAAAAQKR